MFYWNKRMGKEDGIVTAKESDKAITFVHDFNVRNSSFHTN